MRASLAMYPFAHLRSAYDALWHAFARTHRQAPRMLDWSMEHDQAARHPDLVLAQTCGWPWLLELHQYTDIVGAFDVDVPGAENGRYRSAIVCGPNADAPVAVNGLDSLSGWVSLCAVIGRPAQYIATGSHLNSAFAVADGSASMAAIDPVSMSHFADMYPDMVAGLQIVDYGPLVPSLPLVTGTHNPVGPLRDSMAVALTVVDPDVLATLRIRGFVPLGGDDYWALTSLTPPGSIEPIRPMGR